jgi:hypothetical protein
MRFWGVFETASKPKRQRQPSQNADDMGGEIVRPVFVDSADEDNGGAEIKDGRSDWLVHRAQILNDLCDLSRENQANSTNRVITKRSVSCSQIHLGLTRRAPSFPSPQLTLLTRIPERSRTERKVCGGVSGDRLANQPSEKLGRFK